MPSDDTVVIHSAVKGVSPVVNKKNNCIPKKRKVKYRITSNTDSSKNDTYVELYLWSDLNDNNIQMTVIP